MANKESLPEEIETLFRSKQKRRKELANLPFDEKIKILIELQKISVNAKDLKDNSNRLVWDIS